MSPLLLSNESAEFVAHVQLQGNSPILDADSVELHTKLEALKVIDSWLKRQKNLGGGNSKMFYFHPCLGKISMLTNIF